MGAAIEDPTVSYGARDVGGYAEPMAAATASAFRGFVEDPTIYPETDDMGESTLQISISVLLMALIERWLAMCGKRAFVGMNTFFYWKKYTPTESLAPDVYVLPGVSLSDRPPCWKVFETGKVPSFAFEVVSQDVDKDYLVSPQRYDRLGVKELVVFDPRYTASRERLRWQVFRRVGKRGLVRVDASNDDRVASRALGCWLVAVGRGQKVRVRLGTGPKGDKLVPTDAEARTEAERDRKQAERDRKQAERERKQAERDHARERAVQGAEIARLRAELARAQRAG
jgi:Uma2 family endonuclease